MINQTGVSAKISADSSGFTRACSQARLAAAALTKDLKKVKFEGLGSGLHKSSDGKEMISFEQKLRSERKLTNLEYEKTNRLLTEMAKKVAIPDMRSWSKAAMSGRSTSTGGQWAHLEGTQFAGGSRGAGGGGGMGGRGNAYGLGVGYNAIQDLVQGGPMAVANNVPQIIELVAKSPALKMLGVAAVTAVAGYIAYKAGKALYENTEEGSANAAATRYAQNRAASDSKFREKKFGKALAKSGLAGENEGARNAAFSGVVDRGLAQGAGEEEGLAGQRELSSQIRMIRINAIKDPAKQAREVAAEEKRTLEEKFAAEKNRARVVLAIADKEQAAAESRLRTMQAELAAQTKAALTPAEILRKRELMEALPGVKSRVDDARARSSAASADFLAMRQREGQLPARNKLIDAGLDQELKRIEEESFRGMQERGDAEKSRIDQRVEFSRMKKAADKELAEKKKAMQAMEKQLEIAELTSGGRRSHRAEKIQRGLNVDSAAEKYKAAGYNKETARSMAEREVALGERRPGRIRGAGFGSKSGTERGSALDYFDGKHMEGARTSNLDDYEKRRAIPGVGKALDKKLTDTDKVETTKPNPKGDPEVVSILKAILGALGGTAPAAASTSASRTIKGAGYHPQGSV